MNQPPIWQIYGVPQPTGNYQAEPTQFRQTTPTQAIPSIGSQALQGADMSYASPINFGPGMLDQSQGAALPAAQGELGNAFNSTLKKGLEDDATKGTYLEDTTTKSIGSGLGKKTLAMFGL